LHENDSFQILWNPEEPFSSVETKQNGLDIVHP
jgi:hypothetical protein